MENEHAGLLLVYYPDFELVERFQFLKTKHDRNAECYYDVIGRHCVFFDLEL